MGAHVGSPVHHNVWSRNIYMLTQGTEGARRLLLALQCLLLTASSLLMGSACGAYQRLVKAIEPLQWQATCWSGQSFSGVTTDSVDLVVTPAPCRTVTVERETWALQWPSSLDTALS